jgi:ABC-type transport system involved in cytochrome bd biosynthesis fused ATPase/permease subunit
VRTSGSLRASGTPVAYAAQDPLIVSGTIRENIVFGQEFCEQWYSVVLDACALTTDIISMNAGDATFLDEKGAILSGGQRQRVVSIVFACFSNICSFLVFLGTSTGSLRKITLDFSRRSVQLSRCRDREP